ncbi:hypothetical protein [Rubrobacter calidifluminis]|uniref:hypothetical protein n=1 Tax=Rubrobacter calidifluminis TaxID=1392640 RepID=UPI002361ECC7|nr:hypothetical protein [Rubrobacter calidifluminis]
MPHAPPQTPKTAQLAAPDRQDGAVGDSHPPGTSYPAEKHVPAGQAYLTPPGSTPGRAASMLRLIPLREPESLRGCPTTVGSNPGRRVAETIPATRVDTWGAGSRTPLQHVPFAGGVQSGAASSPLENIPLQTLVAIPAPTAKLPSKFPLLPHPNGDEQKPSGTLSPNIEHPG